MPPQGSPAGGAGEEGSVTEDLRISGNEKLLALKDFLAQCRADDDLSETSHNKTALPLNSLDFQQLNAEVDAAVALMGAPVLRPERLQPLQFMLERTKDFLEEFSTGAGRSLGKVVGPVAGIFIIDLIGLLDELIQLVRFMVG